MMTFRARAVLDRVLWMLVAVFVLMVGCGDSTTEPHAPATVRIAPPSEPVRLGDTIQLTAAVEDKAGFTLTGYTITWTSSNDLVATISASGTLAALQTGDVEITAQSEGKAGSLEITVHPSPAAIIEISPDTSTLEIGESRRLSTVVRDRLGSVMENQEISWISGHPNVATVSPKGVVTAVGPGLAELTPET